MLLATSCQEGCAFIGTGGGAFLLPGDLHAKNSMASPGLEDSEQDGGMEVEDQDQEEEVNRPSTYTIRPKFEKK